MKVLWVSASAIGPASRILGQQYGGSSGVWIQTIFEELEESHQAEMYFLCFSKGLGKNNIVHKSSEEGEAYCLNMPQISLGRPAPKYLIRNIEKVIGEIRPDIIQIWGTETCVQNAVAECAPQVPKVVFLQGLIGVHDRYHNADMRKLGLRYKKALAEGLRGKYHDSLFHKQVGFEAKELRKCGNVLVDNMFSTAYCKSLSDSIRVYEYALNPGKVFEEKQWALSACEKHSVFTVYGPSQDKGLHQLLRAVAIVKRTIPDVKVYIPGRYHIDAQTHRLSEVGLSSYERLLASLVRKGGIEENVFFCGQLSQAEMAEHLCRAHVFVNPSAMEVHAGSLREAMMVGIPSISTYCGSVGEYVKEGENGLLYRYEEHEVLAYKMAYLLDHPEVCEKVGTAGRNQMIQSKQTGKKNLYSIYEEITGY